MRKHRGRRAKTPEEMQRRAQREEQWRRGTAEQRQLPSTSEAFNAYYRAQGFVAEDEFEEFLEALRRPLPACFRLNPEYPFTERLKQEIYSMVGDKLEIDGTVVEGAQPLHWYPGGNAFKLGFDKRTMRKSEKLKALQQWMVFNSDVGNLTRQEAVSMVPPLALNVQPGHKVLDMCASPGSKTTQILEVVGNPAPGDEPSNPSGMVVANDVDTERAYMLVKQCRRLNSPSLLITCHPGQLLPGLDWPDDGAEGYFDRVLCDVPCSGDGTLRKNPIIWSKWTPAGGMALHPLQLQIALRGLGLLRIGGMLVYSTCSLSPMEDEAVVAEILRRHRGQVELVDARQFLPGFKCRPGMTSWKVIDAPPKGRPHASKREREQAAAAATKQQQQMNPAELPEDPVERSIALGFSVFNSFEEVPEELQSRVRASVFPPTEEENQWMNLRYCLRCVPHDEDTGGFFVALLRKTGETLRGTPASELETKEGAAESTDNAKRRRAEPAEAVAEVPMTVAGEAAEDVKEEENAEDAEEGEAAAAAQAALEDVPQDVADVAGGDDDDGDGAEGGRKRKKTASAEKYDFVPFPEEHWREIKAFYHISDRFPADQLMVRQQGLRSIHYYPRVIKQFLDYDTRKRLKVVAGGIRMFEHNPKLQSECPFRMTQEAVHLLFPYLESRTVAVTQQDFVRLLGGGMVSFNALSGTTTQAYKRFQPGAVVAYYRYEQDGKEYMYHLVTWRGKMNAVNVLCTKKELETLKAQLQALGVYQAPQDASSGSGDKAGEADESKTAEAAEASSEQV